MFRRLSQCCALGAHLTYTFFQILYGAWKILGFGGSYVSIFGGARFTQKDPYAQKAQDFAEMLVKADVSVLTGGGTGIMEAANCGAVRHDSKAKSVGIGVKDLEEGRNTCAQYYFQLDYFFARKFLLTRYSRAFVVFPGGFGTLDEMAEVITLMQTKHMKRAPIVLIGTEFWNPFMHWIETEAIKHGTLSKEDLKLFTVIDDLERAFCIVRDECKMP